MTPWMLLDVAQAPGNGEELRLYKRGTEFSIRAGKCELMNSRVHGSEDELAKLACLRITNCHEPRILIGGLGMGYTVAAALNVIGVDGRLVVAELVPAVVEWNRGPLAELAGRPLQDERVTVLEVDVARIIQTERNAYDAILLDVDNGPQGLTRKGNDWLYGVQGLTMALATLRLGGVLAIWSVAPDRAFTHSLRKVGFEVEEVRVRARSASRGAWHTIWFAAA